MTPNPKTLTQENPDPKPIATEGTDTDPSTQKKGGTDLPPPDGKDKPHPRSG